MAGCSNEDTPRSHLWLQIEATGSSYYLIKQTLKTTEGRAPGQGRWQQGRRSWDWEAMASALQWGRGVWGSESLPCWTPPPLCLTLGGWGLTSTKPTHLQAPGLFHLIPQKEEAPVPLPCPGAPQHAHRCSAHLWGLGTATKPRPLRGPCHQERWPSKDLCPRCQRTEVQRKSCSCLQVKS